MITCYKLTVYDSTDSICDVFESWDLNLIQYMAKDNITLDYVARVEMEKTQREMNPDQRTINYGSGENG